MTSTCQNVVPHVSVETSRAQRSTTCGSFLEVIVEPRQVPTTPRKLSRPQATGQPSTGVYLD